MAMEKMVTTCSSISYMLSDPDLKAQQNPSPVTLGAAALVIQPSISSVENIGSWDTIDAILYLLNKEQQLKVSVIPLEKDLI